MWLQLDEHGYEVVRRCAEHPTTRDPDILLVEQVLIEYAYSQARVESLWFTGHPVDARGDLVVEPREGLLIQLRGFEGEELFTVIGIVED